MIRRMICTAAVLCLGCGSTADRHVQPDTTLSAPSSQDRPDGDVTQDLRNQVALLVERADLRVGLPGEELEELALLARAHAVALEHERLRGDDEPATVPGPRELEQRIQDLNRRLKVVFVLHSKTDGEPADAGELSGQFLSILMDGAALEVRLPPAETTQGASASELARSSGGLDYLIEARVQADRASHTETLHFFKSRASLSVTHVPSGRAVIQTGFPESEQTKYGDPQRGRAARRSLSRGVRRLAKQLAVDLDRLADAR